MTYKNPVNPAHIIVLNVYAGQYGGFLKRAYMLDSVRMVSSELPQEFLDTTPVKDKKRIRSIVYFWDGTSVFIADSIRMFTKYKWPTE